MLKIKTNALLFAVILSLPAIAAAEFHFEKNAKDAIDNVDRQLAAEITLFLAEYEKTYNDQNYRKLKTMWVADGNPVYMAEEVPFPLYGKARLDNYLNPVPGKKILEGIDNKYSEVRAKYVTPNVAVATYRLDYDLKLMGMPAMHGWDRVMAVFMLGKSGWKMSAYTEAPMGPATMVRKMMKATPAETDEQKAAYATTLETIQMLNQAAVSPGFDEFIKARKGIDPLY